MTQVTKQEIVEALWGFETSFYRADGKRIESWSLAKRIMRYGIAPEQKGEEAIAPPDVDANGCSTHPKARHGFARQASHSEGEYVCECAGFDPYDAGYQDGIRAAWDANGTLLPDGWVLVQKAPNADRLAVKLLVAAGFVTEEKATEALSIAHGFSKGQLASAPEVSNEL